MALAESPRARRQLVHDAGWRTTSFISVLAGTLVAFGAVALVAAAAGAGGSALGVDTDGFSTDEWRRAGVAGAAVAAIVTLVAFFFGGYTAGRMSRRAGARHGMLVFVMSAILIGVVALAGWLASDNIDLTEGLRDNGVPTDESTWSDIGIGAGIAVAVAMVLGAIAGAIRGDRWHGRLASAVIEHRAAVRDEETGVARDGDRIDDDGTRSIDLRDDTMTVEEEQEHSRAF